MRSALIPKVTAQPNLPYIVRFGPYRLHDFVPGDASSILSLKPPNAYDKLVTSTLNKAIYRSFTCRCRILQLSFLKHIHIVELVNLIFCGSSKDLLDKLEFFRVHAKIT